jgi:ketosteroid isomerase-like protein
MVRTMASLLPQLHDAMNSHDAARMAALFAGDYRSAQPVHPHRGFGGSDQVLANWTAVFDGVPDFSAELVASSSDGPVEWSEWEWRGTHTDGSPFLMRGVIILRGRDDEIAQAHLYMEPVEVGGGDIGAALRDLYQP